MAHPCFTSPGILNGINISSANYPPTISLLSFRRMWLWKGIFSKLRDCGWRAGFQLCKGHLSICPTIAEDSIPHIPKSPQKLLFADQKYVSSSWRTSHWRPRWARAPCRLLWLTPWTNMNAAIHIPQGLHWIQADGFKKEICKTQCGSLCWCECGDV